MGTSFVDIKEVSGWRDRRRFVTLPFRIYRDNEYWCPPLLHQQYEMLNRRKHPFYKHADATFFLALDASRRVLGRICVSIDPRYHERHGDNVGCFGMFECVNERTVAHALLDTALTWCKDRGVDSVMGPIDFSTNYQVGLLVEGFDMPQRIMMNYHLPYYKDLIESWGARQEQDLVSWATKDASQTHKWRRKIDRLEKISSITIRPFERAYSQRDVGIIRELSEALLGHQWGFVSPTFDEVKALQRDLRLVPPDMILIAYDGAKPVGFVLNMPDFNEAIRPLKGKLFSAGLPIGLIKLLRGLKRIKCARMAILGVLPEYRFEGIAERLIVKSFEIGRYRHGFSEAEMGWTLDDNDILAATVSKLAGACSRRYRVYRKSVAV